MREQTTLTIIGGKWQGGHKFDIGAKLGFILTDLEIDLALH